MCVSNHAEIVTFLACYYLGCDIVIHKIQLTSTQKILYFSYKFKSTKTLTHFKAYISQMVV